jgi:hypothetical protein
MGIADVAALAASVAAVVSRRLLLPSPPNEKATARRYETGKASYSISCSAGKG